jgi:alpha-D-xyloside xylohydrolase
MQLPYNAAFGGGERFNTVNLKGYTIENVVEEKFCNQGERTYCPIPFFFTDTGFGLFADTGKVTRFEFGEDILVTLPPHTPLFVFSGSPQGILQAYISLLNTPQLPPDWVFLPWVSANRWNSQKRVEEQLQLLEENDFPAGVIVLEAWSDEATFYIWNGAEYVPNQEGNFDYSDFSFDNSPWPEPLKMIDRIHKAGLHLLLWQVPVYKKIPPSEPPNEQNALDRQQAVSEKLCVMNSDGSPYVIPDNRWFSGSEVPDFTNPKTLDAWFSRRKYLLKMGIDGFKTDGGEFIYGDSALFSDGSDAAEMKNRYPQLYTQSYTDFLPENTALFSRAGYSGAHATPILWAGDQCSTFEELRAQLRAGLSSAMSGIIFWGFDIGGFSGELPTPELYLRATQLACFCPIMQWHSEPEGGQFREIRETYLANNERSPWNIARFSDDPEYLNKIRFYHKLRVKLQPYIRKQARLATTQHHPLIYPLAYRYRLDTHTHSIEDQFMLGEKYLVCPILWESTTTRTIYLPEGNWHSCLNTTTNSFDFTPNNTNYATFTGNQTIEVSSGWHIPVFERLKQGGEQIT